MKHILIKILSINIIAFASYSGIIYLLTNNNKEGFALFFYYLFFIALQTAINLFFVIWSLLKNQNNTKYYLTGLLISLIFGMIVFLVLD